MSSSTLKFEDGAVQFRLRIVLSLLSHRSLLIRNIRSNSLDRPGLAEHEASFLRLIEKLTNGSSMEINATGTQLRFKPGLIIGGSIDHQCSGDRCVGWFLEGILPLACFGKDDLLLSLSGMTDGCNEQDPSIDFLKKSILPLMQNHFGVGVDGEESPPPSMEVLQRGVGVAGKVSFYCPTVKELQPLDLLDFGLVKRVRGEAISCRIPPSSCARVAHSCKGLLHRLLPDVWIHTNVNASKQLASGSAPSLSLLISAESTTGIVLTAECTLNTKERGAELAEDLGQRGAALLLQEVQRGGCIDTSSQSIVLLLMCLGPEDVARVRVGTLSHYVIEALRLYKQALGVEFKVTPDLETKTVVLSCLGTGFRNMAKAST